MSRFKTLHSRMHDELTKKRVNARKLSGKGYRRHDMKKITGEHAHANFVWADTSLNNHQSRMRQFSKWLNKEYPELKRAEIDEVNREVLQDYLLSQDKAGYSASTISSDMAMLNKVFQRDLRKDEIDLSERKIDNFTNNRTGRTFEALQPKEKDAVMISRAFGFRRSELLQLNTKSIYQTDDGKLHAYVSGKGGKVRVAECTEKAHSWALKRFEGSINSVQSKVSLSLDREDYKRITKGSDKLLDNVRSNAPIHRLGRQYYARELLSQVERENRQGRLFDQNKAKTIDTYTTNNITMNRYHAQVVSQNLGHSRIDVLKNYIFKC